MKLKFNFLINELGDDFVAVPVTSSNDQFSGILKLNEGGAFIIETLNNEISYEELSAKVAEKFSLTVDEVKENMEGLLAKLREENLIEE